MSRDRFVPQLSVDLGILLEPASKILSASGGMPSKENTSDTKRFHPPSRGPPEIRFERQDAEYYVDSCRKGIELFEN